MMVPSDRRRRAPPAFQEYASDILASREYRTLTLAQRGLMHTMRLEVWVNDFLPEQPEIIAQILGFDPKEIASELPFVMAFFECKNGRITSPELSAYREQLEGVRRKQSAAAKATNKSRWSRKTRANTGDSGVSLSDSLSDSVGDSVGDLVSESLLSRAEPSQGKGMFTPNLGEEVYEDFTLGFEEGAP